MDDVVRLWELIVAGNPVTLLSVGVVLVGLPLVAVAGVRGKRQQRAVHNALVAQWGEEDAARISAKKFWEGMTGEQLEASLGPPLAMDVDQLKTKRRETWKSLRGRLRDQFRLRIQLDDGVVTGWKQW